LARCLSGPMMALDGRWAGGEWLMVAARRGSGRTRMMGGASAAVAGGMRRDRWQWATREALRRGNRPSVEARSTAATKFLKRG